MSKCCTNQAEQTGFEWFGQMIPRCLEYAKRAVAEGRPIVGIMCEYAPRELIIAAGAVPACLCGGNPDTIPKAETRLPANLCPLVKSTYGFLVQHANPFLEMADLVIAEATCDGKKKMFELMGLDLPTYLIEIPQREDSEQAILFLAKEFRNLKTYLEDRFKVKITDAKLRQAIQLMNSERRLRRSIAFLMKANPPPITGRQVLECKSIISCIPEDLKQYQAIMDRFINTGQTESDGTNGRVRVLLTGVPIVHGMERIVDIIEALRVVIVAQENCTGLKPIMEDVEEDHPDPIFALAKKYSVIPCSIKTPNSKRLDLIRHLVKEFRAQAIIDLVWHACLTYSVESFWIKKLAEQELGIPYLQIDTDYYLADAERIGMRVEALVETVASGNPKNQSL